MTVSSDQYCGIMETIGYSLRYGQCMVSTGWDNSSHFLTSIGILINIFPGHLISLRGDIGFFFLWEYLISKVYISRLQSIEQLEDAVCQEINANSHEIISRVIDNFIERFRQSVENNGSHLTDLILHQKRRYL